VTGLAKQQRYFCLKQSFAQPCNS